MCTVLSVGAGEGVRVLQVGGGGQGVVFGEVSRIVLFWVLFFPVS